MLALPSASQTQNLPPPTSPDTGPQTNSDEGAGPTIRDRTKKQEDNAVETLKVNVDVVSLLFNVKDKGGHLLPNLNKDEFQIVEDGKPQNIKYFKAESNLPLTIGILLDTSFSQDRVLPIEKEVGAQFLQRLLRKEDEAFLISFDVNVDLLQDFTNSEHDIRKGMNTAKINGGGAVGGLPGIGQGPVPIGNPKGTLLYDAVYLAAHDKLRSEVGRKALVLLTDGEDQGSQLKLQDALEAAQKSDAIVYVLLISDSGVAAGTGAGLMKKLCEETGGRVIHVGNNRDKLEKAFDQVSTELRSQYSIGYTPTNNKHDGTFRKVEIKTKEGYKVQARKGYYAAAS
ncbi:MAG: VWA domain-containing protein [Acidobacteria bacterium]|nr:MAG: VWA domain-containing protein [Acidobacteriota bacterium]PYY24325.1 MAG: VWA domain-containing protein [Acidobacteriota bacterium]